MNYHKFSDMDERCVGLWYTRNMTEWFRRSGKVGEGDGVWIFIFTNLVI